MADYVLSCCATADLTPEWMERRNLSYVNFHMELDGKQYPDDMGKTITPEILFSSMAAGAMTRTSQVTIGEYEEYFRGFLEKGKDVLHLTLQLMSKFLQHPDHITDSGDNRLEPIPNILDSSLYSTLYIISYLF